MKKIFLYMAVLAIGFTSCDKKEDFVNDMSNVVGAAGDWRVQYDHAVYGTDPFGVGHAEMITFNVSSDVKDSLWITDQGSFWEYKGKIALDLANMTFGSDDEVDSQYPDYPIKMKVWDGVIVKNATTLPSGAVVDSIYYKIWFEDLEIYGTGIPNDSLMVQGYRHSGFTEDGH